MKSYVITVLLAGLFFTATAQTKLTLQQAIELGIRNNADVLQSGLAAERSSVLWKQSRMSRLPNLNASVNQGNNYGKSIDPFTNTFIDQKVTYGSYGANTNILLFNGFSLQNEIKSNKLGLEASEMELQQAKDNLTINIILAYLQVLSAQDVLKQVQEQVLVTKNQVDRLALLNNEGAISPSDYYDLKGQFASEQVSIADSRANVETARLSLSQLLNIPYRKDMEVVALPEENISSANNHAPEEVYDIALQHLAAIKAAGLRTQSAEKNIRSIRGRLLPSLSFGGSMSTNYSSAASVSEYINSTVAASSDYVDVSGTQYPVYKNQDHYASRRPEFGSQLNNNMFYTLNLGLSIPLFNGSNVRSQIKLAEINLRSAQLQEQNTKTLLQQAIERAYLSLVTSSDKYQLLLGQVKSFEESFRIAEVKFNEGVITSVDFLVAKNNLDRAKSNLIISKYDFLLRRKILSYYEGKPMW
ncbi:MAG: TolC family protein [Chitinophagaceae bacterium]|nr:TolC family protein [Chitinophagaceae bacterium]MCW5914836.1 TolC family protein [Chitinophagaceae bacterium]MCZ2396178.1 TolC family protein [Chitinophagales bacterium]